MKYIDTDHHDGTSDATPGGEENLRRPGELLFAVLMLLASLGLLWSAYGIAGFESLSSAGAIPMGATLAMVVSMALIVRKALRTPLDASETVRRDIFPLTVVFFAALLIAYGLLLQPLGFLPTSALFLLVAIKLLGKRSWLWTVGVSGSSLLLIWLIFRIVFSVLMPAGVVPEAEFIQFFRNLSGQGGA